MKFVLGLQCGKELPSPEPQQREFAEGIEPLVLKGSAVTVSSLAFELTQDLFSNRPSAWSVPEACVKMNRYRVLCLIWF